jgi:beta-lactamase class A
VPTAAARPFSPGQEDPGLLAAIQEALGEDAASVSVAVRRLSDGLSASWQAERIFYAASLYKLAVLYEAYRQRELGLLDFERAVPVTDVYAREDLGTLASVPRLPNGDLRIADAVRAMITVSDNTSATILLDLLGHRNIDATLAALGLRATSVNTRELPTTAADMARLMAAIERGEGLSAASAQEMVNLLLAQQARAGIPRGVPAGVPVGNKTGTWSGALHDVAVVYAPTGPFVIAVLTDGSGGWEVVARVAAAVYQYLARLTRAGGRAQRPPAGARASAAGGRETADACRKKDQPSPAGDRRHYLRTSRPEVQDRVRMIFDRIGAGLAGPALQGIQDEGVGLTLVADARLKHVARQHDGVVGQSEQLVNDAVHELGVVAAGQVRAPHRAKEQRVAAEQQTVGVEAHAAGRVPRGVNYLQAEPVDLDHIAVAQPGVGRWRRLYRPPQPARRAGAGLGGDGPVVWVEQEARARGPLHGGHRHDVVEVGVGVDDIAHVHAEVTRHFHDPVRLIAGVDDEPLAGAS